MSIFRWYACANFQFNKNVQISWNMIENCRKFKTHGNLPLKDHQNMSDVYLTIFILDSPWRNDRQLLTEYNSYEC